MLTAMGAAGIGASVTTGVAVGDGPTPFCDDCPEGTTLLAKYEAESDFSFEEGKCDAVEFDTDSIERDEDGEVTGVEFTSSIFFQGVRVKTGNSNGDACDSLTWEEVISDPEEKDGEYHGYIGIEQIDETDAISYIAFCSAGCFQVDFVFGDSIYNLGEDDDGRYSARKIVHLWGNTYTGRLSGTQGGTHTWDGCTVSTEAIEGDLGNGTASVTFEFEGETCPVSLVSYVAPCPIGFNDVTVDQQYRVDKNEIASFDGSGPHTLTVDLPNEHSIGAICDEANSNVF